MGHIWRKWRIRVWISQSGNHGLHGRFKFRWWTRVILFTVILKLIMNLKAFIAKFMESFAIVTNDLMGNFRTITKFAYMIAWDYLFLDFNLKVVLQVISHNDGFDLFLAVWAAIFAFVSPGLYAFDAEFVVAAVNPCFCRMVDFFDANSACFFLFAVAGSHQILGHLSPKQLFFSRSLSLARAYRFSAFWLSSTKSCG